MEPADRRSTTYCAKCERLRRLVTFTRSTRFKIGVLYGSSLIAWSEAFPNARIVRRVDDGWQETDETAWDHSAMLDCGHTKRLITL